MSDEEALRAQMAMVLQEQRSQSQKLDRLTDAMTRLATHEERLSSHYQGMQRLGGRLDSLDERLRGVEGFCHPYTEQENIGGSQWVERLIIGTVSGGAVAVLAFLLAGS